MRAASTHSGGTAPAWTGFPVMPSWAPKALFSFQTTPASTTAGRACQAIAGTTLAHALGTMKLDVKPDRLIAAPETLTEGGLDLRLIPAPSGETPDALFVEDRRHGILVVGDAFMPYLGAPFVAEGSPEGFLEAIALVLDLHPRRLIHGHTPRWMRSAAGATPRSFARRAIVYSEMAGRSLDPVALPGAPVAAAPDAAANPTGGAPR